MKKILASSSFFLKTHIIGIVIVGVSCSLVARFLYSWLQRQPPPSHDPNSTIRPVQPSESERLTTQSVTTPEAVTNSDSLQRTERSFTNSSVSGIIYDYAPASLDETEYRNQLSAQGTYHASITSLPTTRAQAERAKAYLRSAGIVLTVEELPETAPPYLADRPRVLYYSDINRKKAQTIADALSHVTGLSFTAAEGATPPEAASHRFSIHCVTSR